jgi:hypothetical protein
MCACLSLSLSLVNKPRKRDSVAGVCGNSAALTSFFGCEEEIHESIESSPGGTFSPQNCAVKKISECALHAKPKNILLEFFFGNARVQIKNILIKTCVSLVLTLFFAFLFFLYTRTHTHITTHTRQRETKKEMPARSAIAMGGADVMTFVRSTRPGFPKGLKVRDDD